MKLSFLSSLPPVAALPFLIGAACNNPGQGNAPTPSDTSEVSLPWGDEPARTCLSQALREVSSSASKLLTTDGNPEEEEPNSVRFSEEGTNALNVVVQLTESPEGRYSPYTDLDFVIAAGEGETSEGEARFANSVEAVEADSERAAELRAEGFVIEDDDFFVSANFTTDPSIPSYKVSGVIDNCRTTTDVYVCSEGLSYEGQIGNCQEKNPWIVDLPE